MTSTIGDGEENFVKFAATGRAGSQTVIDLWSMLGFQEENVLHTDSTFVAERLYWSCRAPLIHPWIKARWLELLGLGLENEVPIAKRKVVMYMSRSNGQAANGGRRVLNEEDLVQSIEELLTARGLNETLQIFDENTFTNTTHLITYFHDHVSAIVGPHGGALLNHLWTGRDTLVLELQSNTFPGLMFYEGTKILDQAYAVQMLESTQGTDMLADVEAVLEVLKARLGRGLERGEKVRLSYGSWAAGELGLDPD